MFILDSAFDANIVESNQEKRKDNKTSLESRKSFKWDSRAFCGLIDQY